MPDTFRPVAGLAIDGGTGRGDILVPAPQSLLVPSRLPEGGAWALGLIIATVVGSVLTAGMTYWLTSVLRRWDHQDLIACQQLGAAGCASGGFAPVLWWLWWALTVALAAIDVVLIRQRSTRVLYVAAAGVAGATVSFIAVFVVAVVKLLASGGAEGISAFRVEFLVGVAVGAVTGLALGTRFLPPAAMPGSVTVDP
jgi:hypothetical protein